MTWENILKAEKFYQNLGFNILEVPWFVGEEAILATAPEGKRQFSTFAGNLVASGEQSFIQLMLEGRMPMGYHQCTTPCFRDDDLDEFHHQYFMKTELIYFGPKDRNLSNMYSNIMGMAKYFFNTFTPVEIVKTEIGFDIVSGGIELGSYGIRKYKDFSWVYGTGCAEPRLSQVTEMAKNDN